MIDTRTRIAIVGARGAVGRELSAILESRGARDVKLLGRSACRETGQKRLTRSRLADRDIVFLCTPSEVSRRWAPLALERGAVVIDNSSAYRLDETTPLVVPEVNPESIDPDHSRLYANPNCSTILLLLALAPLHRAFGCERAAVTTYQAASGAGAAAMGELEAATAAALAGRAFAPRVFREPAAFNCFSHDSAVDPTTGSNGEEDKIERESRRILGPQPRVTATCVRVPVLRAHCEAVNLTLTQPVTAAEARGILASASGLELIDDTGRNSFPTSLGASGRDAVLVGRVRVDRSQPWEGEGKGARGFGLHLFLAGDQLRKGAALNAVQIAEAMFPQAASRGEPLTEPALVAGRS